MYKGEGINALVCAAEDLKNSGLIYVPDNLKRLLRCVAYYDEFKKVVAECFKDFDYENEKRGNIGVLGGSDVIRLPKSKERTVAFVLGLLLEFDSGDLDIVAFATRYFPADTKQQSFRLFCENVVEPFKFALVDLVWNGTVPEEKEVKREVSFANPGVKEQTERLLVDLSEGIRAALNDCEDREELLVMLEGLAVAIDQGDALMTNALWLGLRRALQYEGICEKEARALNDTLRLYQIVR